MTAVTTPAGAAPEPAVDWHAIDWKKVYGTVRRLQARIVKAIRVGRWGKVRALVYLLTHSFAGRALAILRVTTNSGATTAGVDGVVWNTPQSKGQAFQALRQHGYQATPLRRVYIPKSNGTMRPLGIPTMNDRAMQALYLLGLDPILETLADPHSYGFRKDRNCADALARCHALLSGANKPEWILEGDIKSCFDRIGHDWLMAHVPMNKVILQKWLKAGFFERNVLFATTAGTPQGGIISPALANCTLDGLEGLLQQRFGGSRGPKRKNKVHLVRYADDFIITGTSQALLHNEVQPLVEQFLHERGLELSHEKTRITHIEDGFDFLGQNVRRYRDGKVLLTPSRRNVQTFLRTIREVIKKQGGCLSAGELIRLLNPKLLGWARYHRHASSKATYSRVDTEVFAGIWKWLRRRHPQRSAAWLRQKYFRRVKHNHWVFCGQRRGKDGKVLPIFLCRVSTIKIRRHILIRGAANPYDPSWERYFEERLQEKMEELLGGAWRRRELLREQGGACPVCGEPITEETGWQEHHMVWRVYGGEDVLENLLLLHPNCHRQVHSQKKVVGKTASREGRS
jgi:RNA-directed DNA polymerase